MSFTTIFVALLIERFFDFSHLRKLGWYAQLQRLISQKLPGQTPYIVLVATMLPLIIGVWLVGFILEDMLFGFVKLAFSVFVILYCLGPRNLWADLYAANSTLASGDVNEAASKLKSTFDITATQDAKQNHRELINHFFVAANRRVFAILFWYSCVGVVGVVLYRFLTLAASDEQSNNVPALTTAAAQADGYLNWPAIRLLTFIFALGGNFGRVISIWVKKVGSGPDANDALLLDCGNAALNSLDAEKIATDGTAEKEAISLFDRSLIITLVIVAVLVYLV